MAQKWYQKASVQVAIVTTIGVVIITFITIGFPLLVETPKLKEENLQLKQNIQEKTIEVQRLENLLTPFKTIALERYTGSESDVLKKLAEQIIKLQSEDIENLKRIKALEGELQEAKELAKPPQLLLQSQKIESIQEGYKIILQFASSKNEPMGIVMFVASLPETTQAKILNFWPTGGTFSSGEDSKKITEDGKMAKLAYQPLAMGLLTVELEISATTQVMMQGSHNLQPFMIDIK